MGSRSRSDGGRGRAAAPTGEKARGVFFFHWRGTGGGAVMAVTVHTAVHTTIHMCNEANAPIVDWQARMGALDSARCPPSLRGREETEINALPCAAGGRSFPRTHRPCSSYLA
eukprot:352756-Chlamydomonas_euryale.AAC.2